MRNWIERVIQRKSFPFIIEIFDDPDIKKAITTVSYTHLVAHADILEAHHGSAKMTRRARGRKAARRLASPPGAP